MSSLEPQPVAVTVIGGFLGAGKTSLVNHLIRQLDGVPTAVLVNDFGSINIDASQIVGVEEGIIQLSNGCICCTIRNDVSRTLLSLIEDPPTERLRHVLIEASGVSDPRAIAQSMLELQRLGAIRLDGMISVVDAEHFDLTGEHRKLLRAQIQAADVVILNKIDLVDAQRNEAVRGAIRSVVPASRIIDATEAQVPAEAILAVETDTARLEGIPVLDPHVHEAAEGHAHGFATHTFRTERPLRWTDLAPVLTDLGSIIRVKGLVSLAERPGDRILLHVVGRRVYVRTIEPWGEETPHTELVMIGPAGGFDPEAIDRRLLACA